jgi:PAS domain S-box-containing protein
MFAGGAPAVQRENPMNAQIDGAGTAVPEPDNGPPSGACTTPFAPPSVDFLASVFDALPEHVAVIDQRGVIVAVNESWRRFARENGAAEPAGSRLGVNYLGICAHLDEDLPHEEAATVRAGILDVLEGRRDTLTIEYPCHSPTEQRWFRVTVVPLRGVFEGAIVSHHNITELRLAENENRRREQLFRACIDHATDGFTLHGKGGVILDVNRQMCERLGFSREELIGADPSLFDPNYTRGDVEALNRRLQCGETVSFESVHRRKDGSEFPVEISIRGFTHGDSWQAVALARDISARRQANEERHRLQAQLEQSQRIESVGRLAGGVAHDFNNMLGVIIGHTDLALQQLAGNDPLQMHLLQIEKACQRSATLTRQLLAFARRQAVAPQVLDLNQNIEAMLSLLPRLLGENVSVTWTPMASLWPVQMDPAQVDQIVTNLCVNARDAISDVGTISIETSNVSTGEADRPLCANAAPGDYVRLTVRDDGCGIEPDLLSHIFEPFFTTKGAGKGTGLGLSTVHGIVHQNGGFITVDSRHGQGARFDVFIPRRSVAVEAGKPRSGAMPVGPIDGGILIVEDEPALLRLTAKMLRSSGYKVFTAESPEQARRLADTHASEINLLLCDVVMPEMNGRELADVLTAAHPQLKCMFMSGYPGDVIADCGVLAEGIHFLEKPFSSEELFGKVREVLGAAAA